MWCFDVHSIYNQIQLSQNIWSLYLTFTFMHLADAFIQSDLQYNQVIHFFCQYVCSLGIEPTTFALLTQCSTTEPQEHLWSWDILWSHKPGPGLDLGFIIQCLGLDRGLDCHCRINILCLRHCTIFFEYPLCSIMNVKQKLSYSPETRFLKYKKKIFLQVLKRQF